MVQVSRDRHDDRAVREDASVKPWVVGDEPWVVGDELWAVIEPSPPAWPELSPGPRPVPDRLCLQGILFVLHTEVNA
ncbi:hypothetical protein ABZ471_21160 [Streptomyces sp. NPDC005728]|uniref:hypothetical protein n=1 Tax=Streptomyces sp. NPDC005728 TaxID=3157054 RepID=UPI0033DC107F